MSKYVKRVIPFESSDIPAIQKWLEDMARKGLQYRDCGFFCARFEKCEPRETRYRLDFCDVIACDIPEEKKEMYERNGWQVVGEFKSDLVVLLTDDPDAPEIYTDHSCLVKPLKGLWKKHLAYCILFFLMFLFSRIGGPINVLISGKGSVVSNLIFIGTGYYCLLLLMAIFLLLEFIVHLRRAIHLKKLIKNIEKGGELPTGEKYRSRSVVGSILVPLSIPVTILWALHFVLPYGQRSMPWIEDASGLPFPTIEELGIDCDYDGMNAYDSSDLLAGRVIDFSLNCLPGEGESEDAVYQYRVEYYDMRCESYAQEFIDGEIDEMVNYNREMYRLKMERISEDSRFDYKWDGYMPEYSEKRLEKDGTDIYLVKEKFSESELCIIQFMYIKLGKQLVKVQYHGPGEILDYAGMYIDELKRAE